MNKVDGYISSFDGVKNEWLTALVSFMREAYPQISETFDHKMPIYQGDGFYVAFAAQKNYFSFYTDDEQVLALIKDLLPGVSLGKSVARVKYSANGAVEVLIDVIKEVVDYHNARPVSYTHLRAHETRHDLVCRLLLEKKKKKKTK